MITRKNKLAATVGQWAAKDAPLSWENGVRNVGKEWAEEFINLYESTDKYANRDYAIINKLGELYDGKTALGLKFLLDHVDKNVRKEYAYSFMANDVAAEQSSMTMKIKWIGYTDKKRPNNGRIRIFLNKSGKEVLVHFLRKPSFILYLMCLLDVYNQEKRVTVDFSKRDELFCELFEKVYAYDGGMAYFNTLIGKGNSEQELLRHCVNDIRHTLICTCGLLNEEATPYILSNKKLRLYVQKEDIFIEQKVLEKIRLT